MADHIAPSSCSAADQIMPELHFVCQGTCAACGITLPWSAWDLNGGTEGEMGTQQMVVQSVRLSPDVVVGVCCEFAGANADDGGVSQETFNSFLRNRNGTFGIQ